MAQRWVQGQLTEMMETLGDELGVDDARLYADLLSALEDGPADLPELSERVDAPPPIVRDALDELADRGAVRRDADGWRLVA